MTLAIPLILWKCNAAQGSSYLGNRIVLKELMVGMLDDAGEHKRNVFFVINQFEPGYWPLTLCR